MKIPHWFTFGLGMALGAVLVPAAHAGASGLESKLERCARAAERIADAIEKASR